MKRVAVIALLAGLLAATLLVLSQGAAGIWRSAAIIGLGGFGAIVAYRLGVVVLTGAAWWLLGRGRADARLPHFLWGRLIRASAADALPLSQVGGPVLGARALAIAGVAGPFAAASTVIDVTIELVAQLLYTALGLFLLDRLHPGTGLVVPVLIGIAAMAGCVIGFVAVQARGFGVVERVLARMARELLGRDRGETGAVQAGITALHRRHGTLLACLLAHLACWLVSGIETWIALRLMGVEIGLPVALTIDSLLYGMRTLAFIVPNALGVQEGALLLLGGLFGVDASAALALSLIKRARDLVIGVPALLGWQAIEGRRAFGRRGLAPVPVRVPADALPDDRDR
ncbi:MAG: lysylphosphatidylglycerol synthase domain-containing protein [Dongiaceae bacterium]